MLISWSASIDQAERYQMFLSNVSNSSFEANTLFYNCTFPWFGPFCGFAFDLTDAQPLKKIVFNNFQSRMLKPDIPQVTCYKHLQCETSLICLDWREICDGKVDCLDESDEFNCWQLEMNECSENEYRCSSGQCIPGNFFRDYQLDPDCLDRTDEYNTVTYNPGYPESCWHDPAFRCEENTCQPGKYDVSCNDGSCHDELTACHNRRNKISNNHSCSYAVACLLDRSSLTDYAWCEEYCAEEPCVQKYCPPFFEFLPRLVFIRTR